MDETERLKALKNQACQILVEELGGDIKEYRRKMDNFISQAKPVYTLLNQEEWEKLWKYTTDLMDAWNDQEKIAQFMEQSTSNVKVLEMILYKMHEIFNVQETKIRQEHGMDKLEGLLLDLTHNITVVFHVHRNEAYHEKKDMNGS